MRQEYFGFKFALDEARKFFVTPNQSGFPSNIDLPNVWKIDERLNLRLLIGRPYFPQMSLQLAQCFVVFIEVSHASINKASEEKEITTQLGALLFIDS